MWKADRPLSDDQLEALKKIQDIGRSLGYGDRPSGGYILDTLGDLGVAKEYGLGAIVTAAIRASSSNGAEALKYYKEVAWYANKLAEREEKHD